MEMVPCLIATLPVRGDYYKYVRHQNYGWIRRAPGRKNIVITRQEKWKADGVVAVKSWEDAMFLAKQTDVKEVMVIGGGEIFKMVFDKAQRIYMTRIEATPEGDAFFPEIDPRQWRLVSQKKYEADEKNIFNHSFETWERN